MAELASKSTIATKSRSERLEAANADRPSAPAPKPEHERQEGGPVRTNPFYLADRCPKASLSGPKTPKSSARALRPRRLSDCVPRRFRKRSPSDSISNSPFTPPDGQHGREPQLEVHSLCCSAPMIQSNLQEGRRKDSLEDRLRDNLHAKVHQLHRHTENLHKSKNARDRLTITPDKLDCGSGSDMSEDLDELDTPTKGSRKPHVQNPGDNARHALGETSFFHDSHQEDRKGNPQPRGLQIVEYNNHSGREIPSRSNFSFSGEIKEMERELVSCPEPLAIKHKSDGNNGDGSSQTARPLSDAKENGRRVQVDNLSPQPAHKMNISHSTALTDGTAAMNSSAPELPSMTGYKHHRRNTQLCAQLRTPSAEPDPWPVLKKVEPSPRQKLLPTPNQVPWSQTSLRKVSGASGVIRQRSICSTPSEWRKNLRKTNKPLNASGSNDISVGTPVSEWRGNLTRAEIASPRPSHGSIPCESCNLPEFKLSTVRDGAARWCSHKNTASDHMKAITSDTEDPFTEPRLSVRAVENSLAWKRVQDNLERQAQKYAGPRPISSSEGSQKLIEEEEEVDKVKRSSPDSNHYCSWRDRCVSLRDEIVKMEAMMGSYKQRDESTGAEPTPVKEESSSDEVGIEGLTIVIHMTDGDDLVVSTDLNGREYKAR